MYKSILFNPERQQAVLGGMGRLGFFNIWQRQFKKYKPMMPIELLTSFEELSGIKETYPEFFEGTNLRRLLNLMEKNNDLNADGSQTLITIAEILEALETYLKGIQNNTEPPPITDTGIKPQALPAPFGGL